MAVWGHIRSGLGQIRACSCLGPRGREVYKVVLNWVKVNVYICCVCVCLCRLGGSGGKKITLCKVKLDML